MRFIAVGLLSLFVASGAFATNGYFSHGYGTQHKGMAGAGVALSLSSLSGATNPASMVFLDQRYDVGLALFSPDRGYTVTGNPSGFPQTFPLTPGEIKSDSKLFVIPSLGANWLIGKENAVGVLIYGNGGMNTNYPTTTFNGPAPPTGVDLNQLFLNATYARLLAPGHSLGISGIVGYQWFKAEGLQAFAGFSSKPTSLTNNGYDNALGFGARIGYLGQFTSWLSFGASFQSKIYMPAFEKYAGLFAEQGDFDIPANWTAGIAVLATPDVTFALDVQQILYSGIKSIHNPFRPSDLQSGKLLGMDDGPGFGWEDMTVVKFGVQYQGGTDGPGGGDTRMGSSRFQAARCSSISWHRVLSNTTLHSEHRKLLAQATRYRYR